MIRSVPARSSSARFRQTATFPPNRLGPHGDDLKVGCVTCHKGTFKPLNGVSPLTDYLALSGVGKVPPGTPSEAPAAQKAGPKR